MSWIHPYLFRRLPRYSVTYFADEIYIRWNFSRENRIFLTFDDGPQPEITDQVLEILAKYEAEATFFLLGKNVHAYPMLAQKIVENGHGLGNHSYSHPDGWKTDAEKYGEDVQRCQAVLPKCQENPLPYAYNLLNPLGPELPRYEHNKAAPFPVKKRKIYFSHPKLFRPPFGHFTWSQYKWLKSSAYITILWTHLSLDFRAELSPEKVLKWLVKGRYKTGDIIVFHDSQKAAPRMLYALPRFIETMMEKGYIFESMV